MRFFTRIFSLTIFLLAFSMTGIGQGHGVCGTVTDATKERLLKNRAAVAQGLVKSRAAITYVPIKYHLVAKTDGTGRVNEDNVMRMHCFLNDLYEDQEIQFFIKDGTFNEINNDAVYNEHTRTEGTFMQFNKDAESINVFITKEAEPASGSIGTTLGYYSPSRDWIVLRSDQVNGQSTTFPHEMGHFLSLLHPHNGWDRDPFTPSSPTWPKAPITAPNPRNGMPVPTELMDRSNCMVGGDYLCDTAPDYNFGFGWTNCNYNRGALDPNDEVVDPDETLIMGYFLDNCVTNFSPEQKAMMEADLASSERNYLDVNSYSPPPGTIVAGDIVPVFPSNGGTAPHNGGTVELDWSFIPGADHYIVEYATNPILANSTKITANASSIELTGLNDKTTYYYKLRPFNLVNTCSDQSGIFNFKVDSDFSSVEEIDFVNDFKVFPNPATLGGAIYINLNSEKFFDATVEVYNLTGQKVYQSKEQFTAGNNQISINPNSISNGVYTVLVTSDSGILKEKFVVND